MNPQVEKELEKFFRDRLLQFLILLAGFLVAGYLMTFLYMPLVDLYLQQTQQTGGDETPFSQLVCSFFRYVEHQPLVPLFVVLLALFFVQCWFWGLKLVGFSFKDIWTLILYREFEDLFWVFGAGLAASLTIFYGLGLF